MSRTASPLRYPGGKSSLLDLTATILQANGLDRGHYVEPFAGGGGLALSLLYGGHVAEIHINDIDPYVWAFWHCALNETADFLAMVEGIPVTIDEWLVQREFVRSGDTRNTLKCGFAAFFLNRTNRSGIIKGAGVIGGLDQRGPYKLDCRYNLDDLLRRIARIQRYKDRVHLSNLDALDFLIKSERELPRASTLLFIDPPYFNKGANLYTSFYKPGDHANLAKVILATDLPWIVTYDDTPEIRMLYRSRRQYCFDIQYSIQDKRMGTELLVAGKGIRIPVPLRANQVNPTQHRAGHADGCQHRL
jgi:DNA adenine methylase